MITLRWSRFPESDVISYNLWRTIIGFEVPLVNLNTKTLQLKINGGSVQTFTFTNDSPVDTINASIVNGRAYLSSGGTKFIVRSNIRSAPGSVQVIGGTAMVDLGLNPVLITEKSDPRLIAVVTANVDPLQMEEYVDNDGAPEDFYAISSISSSSVESLKTLWAQPIMAAGPLCVLEGIVCDLQGVRIPDAEVIATLHTPPKNINMAYITKEPIRTLSGPDGRFSLPLLQCAMVKLEIPAVGFTKMVTIPQQSYIFIKDLLMDADYTYPLGYRP